jgi:simple sugar transport system permease protein
MIILVFLMQTVRIAIPYLFAAAGGVIAERSGVISLGLEGYMLSGAFAGALGSYYSGSPWIGVLCGLGGGLLFALIHALVSLRFRADQVVSGIAINLLVIGLTRFLLKLLFDSSSNSPRVEGFTINPLIAMGLLAPVALAWLVYRTPFGLRVRAVGEHPQAAETLGVRPRRVRLVAVALSGMLASLGGVTVGSAARRARLSPLRGGRDAADPAAGNAIHPVAVHPDDPVRPHDRRAGRRRRPGGASRLSG